MNLKSKLITAFLVLGLIPAFVLGWQVYQASLRMEQGTTNMFQNVASQVVDKIDRNLFERYGDVQAFGANRAVLDRASWYRAGSENNAIARVANRYANLYGFYLLSMLVDLEGRVIAVNDRDPSGRPINTAWLYNKNFKNSDWFQSVQTGRFLSSSDGSLTGTYVQDVYVDEDIKQVYGGEALVLGFSAGVKDEQGRVIAVWNNRATFSLVEEIFVSAYRDLKSQSFGSAELTLVDRTGRVLVDYDPTRDGGNLAVGHDLGVLLKLNLAERGVEGAKRVVLGESGGVRSLNARKNMWQTSGYAVSAGALGFPGLKWGALVRVDEAEALAAMRSLHHKVFWVLGLAVLGLTCNAPR